MRLVYTVGLAVLLGLPASAQTLVPDDDVPGVLVEQGYDLRLAVDGLNYPSNLAFGDGRVWVTESGFAAPDVPPTVLEVTLPASGRGTATVILTPAMLPMGRLLPPFTDATYRDGMLYLAHRQVGANGWRVGAYSRFSPDDPAGTFETLVTNLPSVGDHSNNTLVFGADGRAYFGQGTATNTGVVGPDNSWVEGAPGFREIAPVEVVLNGAEFTARVPSGPDPDANAVTAPYRPFDSGPVDAGFRVAAATPATPQDGIVAGSGTVYSFDPDADDPTSTLRLEAWGLRNPFGLAFDAQDPTRLFVSNNGSDIRGRAGDPNDPLDPSTFVVRGSRPVAQEYDELFVMTVGGDVEFFGWPEFFHDPATGQPLLASDPLFCQSPRADRGGLPRPDLRRGVPQLADRPAGVHRGRAVRVRRRHRTVDERGVRVRGQRVLGRVRVVLAADGGVRVHGLQGGPDRPRDRGRGRLPRQRGVDAGGAVRADEAEQAALARLHRRPDGARRPRRGRAGRERVPVGDGEGVGRREPERDGDRERRRGRRPRARPAPARTRPPSGPRSRSAWRPRPTSASPSTTCSGARWPSSPTARAGPGRTGSRSGRPGCRPASTSSASTPTAAP